MSEQSYCPNCGAPGVHYVVPGLGEAGFFICSPDTSKPPAPPVVETEQEQPACTICGKGPFPTLRNWAYHDCKSLTPRTDAFHKAVNLYKDKNNLEGQICVGTPRDQFECVAFSRQLERSLTAAQLELDRLKADLKLANEAYEILTGLLNRRFPPTPEGLPDFKVEDVLRENVALTRQRDGLVKALEDISKSADGRWSADHAIAALAAARKETNDR